MKYGEEIKIKKRIKILFRHKKSILLLRKGKSTTMDNEVFRDVISEVKENNCKCSKRNITVSTVCFSFNSLEILLINTKCYMLFSH